MGNSLASVVEQQLANENTFSETRATRQRYGILWILAAALALRLAVLFLGSNKGLFYPDEFEYAELAKNLATHNEFSYKGQINSFRPPGFPFIMSLAFRLSGSTSPVPARLLQVLLSVATVWVMYHLGKDGWGERVGRIAAAIFAFYPTFIGYTNILLTELSCIFFVSLFCWMMLRCLQKPNFGWAVAAGAALGVCALIRDTLFYAGPIMTVFLGLWGWRARRSFLKPAAIFAGSFILTILPWCVRNTALNGQPTLISSVGGITFYLCNNEKAPLIRSSSLFYEKQIGEEYYYETLLPELNGLSETEKNDIVTRMAFEYMLANPGATIIRMLGRFVDFWGQERLVINHLVSGYYGNLPSTLTMMLMAAVIGGYSLIMAGACIGCFFSRLRAFEIFGFIFIAYYTAMHLLVFAHPRYHLPLLPLIILIAARAYADRAAIIKNWRTRQFAGAAGLFIVFVVMWIIGLFVFDASYLEKFMQRLG